MVDVYHKPPPPPKYSQSTTLNIIKSPKDWNKMSWTKNIYLGIIGKCMKLN